mmetsp:Transcript_74600/g.207347  ORF Transcript_74600/g.207347 Transcript_74600/m.207347 type:complete len:305 (-) Transcript_74600:53-967(-)
MSAPPPEAVKQDDGSWILELDDGSIQRWTRRPDGTWRKPEHRRAGWVGELEQKKYISKGTEIAMRHELGRIPGAPSGGSAPDGTTAQTKAQKKNEHKKEQRKVKAAAKDAERPAEPSVDSPTVAPAAALEAEEALTRNEAPQPSEGDAADSVEQGIKMRKALEKKLRQVAELQERQSNGETLNEDQLAKLASRPQLEADLRKLTRMTNGEHVTTEPMVDAPPRTGSGAHEAADRDETTDAEKPQCVARDAAPAPGPGSRKALEKKLRQISELVERQKKGDVLNEDQLAKIASRPQLEGQLRNCE